jgi:hypothetical protein
MCAEASTILKAVVTDFFFDGCQLEVSTDECSAHTRVRQRLCAGPSIESVPVSQCWMWMQCPRVGCRKSRLVC